MKRFIIAAALLLGPLWASSAEAQSRPFYASRGAEHAAQGGIISIQIVDKQDNRCFDVTGCFMLENAAPGKKLVGLYLDIGSVENRATPTWGPNQFLNMELMPHQAIVTLRTGDASMCGLPAMLVFEDIETREKQTIITSVDLCQRELGIYRMRARLEDDPPVSLAALN